MRHVSPQPSTEVKGSGAAPELPDESILISAGMSVQRSRSGHPLHLRGGEELSWDLFNIVEEVVDHLLLGIHHVNETAPREQWIWWDIALALLVRLRWMASRGRRFPGEGRGNPADAPRGEAPRTGGVALGRRG
jgi:hypothetical protein